MPACALHLSACGHAQAGADRGDHTKLRALELADEVALLACRVTERFLREELYGLTAHMRRAAISVPSHIVEGCARYSQADNLRFLYRTLGSLRELHCHIRLSQRLGFLFNDDVSLSEPTIIETEKVLNGLIKSLRVV
ncbi:MAG: four helix bundle protein [Deltaproteobacteria bacterium]|nr:four helix bundle protein [Deltaproteobacteria bacterium]